YSQSLKTLGEYEKSKSVFGDFKSMAASLESLVYDEDYLEKIKANSGRYEVKPFPYNSKYTDFAASFYFYRLLLRDSFLRLISAS
ncbi:MAG: flagellar motor protein MotB, partial [Cyanobacteria bacterium J06639_18]